MYAPGDVIGDKYKLVRPRGSGGMGTVWIARDRVLAVQVALKIVSLPGHDMRAIARRVLEEARTAARLGHAAIVRVNDFGITKLGDPYLVLELLEGEDLADLLAKKARLGAAEAVTVMLPIAHALATAHENGIVHRDVKPENVFLAQTEVGLQPKLLDFGIARFTDTERTNRLTMDGTVMGTPDYLSPEMTKGEAPTWAADSWSFCVLLYEVVTGRCPFRGDDYYALARSIVEDEVPSFASLGVDEPELEATILRGLQKRLADRWESMRELGQQLAQWCLARGITEDATGQSLRRAWFRGDSSLMDGTTPGSVAELVVAAGAPTSLVTFDESRGRQGSWVGGPPSEPELEAIAALHSDGDPEDLFARASLRRLVGVGAVLFGGVLVGVLLFLAGARWIGGP